MNYVIDNPLSGAFIGDPFPGGDNKKPPKTGGLVFTWLAFVIQVCLTDLQVNYGGCVMMQMEVQLGVHWLL